MDNNFAYNNIMDFAKYICSMYEKMYISQISKKLRIPKTDVIYYINYGICNFSKQENPDFFTKLNLVYKVCKLYIKEDEYYTVKSLAEKFNITTKNISHMLHDGIRLKKLISQNDALKIKEKIFSNVRDFTKLQKLIKLEEVYQNLFFERNYSKLDINNEIQKISVLIQEVSFLIDTYDSAEEEYTESVSLEYLLEKKENLKKQLYLLKNSI